MEVLGAYCAKLKYAEGSAIVWKPTLHDKGGTVGCLSCQISYRGRQNKVLRSNISVCMPQ